MMQLGVDGVFVGSGIFKADEPERKMAKAIVRGDDALRQPRWCLAEGLDAASAKPMSGMDARPRR